MTVPAKLQKPRCSYLICTSPRSGSWLLSDGLEATGLAGRPREWFHKNAEVERSQAWGIPAPGETGYAPYLSRTIRAATTPNGVLGIKIHWYQFELLPAKLATVEGLQGLPFPEALARLLPNLKFIWLTRRNKIRQAISLHRARQTGTWWHEESFPKKLPPRKEARFDPQLIDSAERHLLSNETGWQNFFRSCNIKPFRIIYEDFVEDYERTMRKVLAFLEIPEGQQIAIAPPRVKTQSDGTTEQWLQQYVDFKRNKKAQVANKQSFATAIAPTSPVEAYEPTSDSRPQLNVAESPAPRIADKPQDRARRRTQWLEQTVRMYGKLARLDPDRAMLERCHGLSAAEFLKRFYAANRPIILTDLQTDRQLIAHLTPEFFKSALAEKVIEMPVRRNAPVGVAANGDPGKSIPFAKLIDEQILAPSVPRKACFTAPSSFFRRPDGLSVLKGLNIFPDYLDLNRMPAESFIGLEPAGFFSPLRNEPVNVLLLQIYGTKRVRLIPWYEFGSINNLMATANDTKQSASQDSSALDVTLSPGEALFVPLGWYHSERAEDVNISLALTNFLFPNRFGK